MLIRFRSTATEPITMFSGVAMQLIRMLGASAALPGAVGADDIPAAIARLRGQLQASVSAGAVPADRGGGDDASTGAPETPVPLATRAVPLISVLERAAARGAPVMWEVA